MRLRLEAPSTAPCWLVGDPTVPDRQQSDVLKDTWQITRQNQAIAGPGYESKIYYDRGNQGIAFDAQGHWIFANEFQRMAFLASLAPADGETGRHKWAGACYVRIEQGDSWEDWPIPGAIISLASVVHSGRVGLILTYRVQAPGVSQVTTTGAYDWLLDAEGEPLLDAEGRRLASAEHDD